jgi:predicted dehydrogenase
MNKLKIGLIGVGGIAESRHIPAYLKLSEQVEITAVSDVNLERAKEVAAKYNIAEVYEDYHNMLNQVDAVTVCTPNKFHSEITIASLKAGVHVLCEKPMASSIKECEEMIAAAEQSGKVLAIAYHYRFMKNSQAAKRVMLAKEVGNPLVTRVQGLRRRKVPGWGVFTNKELQGGGSLIDYGCHLLDLSLWLMGNPKPIEVSGSTYNNLSKSPEQVNQWGEFNHETFDVDDHVTAYVKFDTGASMLLETSWAANIREDAEHVSISGDKGGLEVFPFQLNKAQHGMLLNSNAAWIPGEDNPGLPQAQNFVNTCLGLEELVVKPEQALQTSQIIESIYRSSESGQAVKIN